MSLAGKLGAQLRPSETSCLPRPARLCILRHCMRTSTACNSSVANHLPGSRGRSGRLAVVCMAHPRRVAKVAAQIQREISELFITDPVVQAAICQERKTSLDDALSAVASLTHVYVSNDLQVVKAYVSVFSDEVGKRRALRNLKNLEPYVRRHIGHALSLRLTPEIRFEYDDSLEEAELVEKVLGEEEVSRFKAELAQQYPEYAQEADQLAQAAAAAGGELDAGAADDEEGYEDEDEAMFREEESLEEAMSRPGPFDELFDSDRGGAALKEASRKQGRFNYSMGSVVRRAAKAAKAAKRPEPPMENEM